MSRVLLGLFLLATVLVLVDHWEQSSRQRQRAADSRFFALGQAEFQTVSAIHIHSAVRGIDWTYRRLDGHWRYPAYHDAFAQPSTVDRLLRSLLKSSATVVAIDANEHAHFGVGARGLRINLQDAEGGEVLDVHAGRGAPGPASGEAYVRQAAGDTVFHLHANPLLALGGGDPPMLDPHLLPRSLERNSVARMRFTRSGESRSPRHPLSLRRVQAAPPLAPTPARPPGRTFAWVADFSAGEDTVLNQNAYALVSFIQRLKYTALHDPERSRSRFAGEVEEVELTDADGNLDVLVVGSQEGENTFLRNVTTGQVFTVASAKVALLFPTRAALTDTLPSPPPYQLVEPFGR